MNQQSIVKKGGLPRRQFARFAFHGLDEVREQSDSQIGEVVATTDLDHPVVLSVVADHRIHRRVLLDNQLDRCRKSRNDRIGLLRNARRLGEAGDNNRAERQRAHRSFSFRIG